MEVSSLVAGFLECQFREYLDEFALDGLWEDSPRDDLESGKMFLDACAAMGRELRGAGVSYPEFGHALAVAMDGIARFLRREHEYYFFDEDRRNVNQVLAMLETGSYR
jgi:hypothetical protein